MTSRSFEEDKEQGGGITGKKKRIIMPRLEIIHNYDQPELLFSGSLVHLVRAIFRVIRVRVREMPVLGT